MTSFSNGRPRATAALLAVVAAITLSAFSPSVIAACAGSEITADTPDARFTTSGEQVTDVATGLVWKRCAEGLSGAACEVGTVVTGKWSDALARAATVNAAPATLGAGANDWRLPNRNELASLVERKCTAPSINAIVFPGTPAQSFWSSSPHALNASLAWSVDYGVGDVGPDLKTNPNKNIRLVRGGN